MAIRRADAFAFALSQEGEDGGFFERRAGLPAGVLLRRGAPRRRHAAPGRVGAGRTPARARRGDPAATRRTCWAAELLQLRGEAEKTARPSDGDEPALGVHDRPEAGEAVLPVPGAISIWRVPAPVRDAVHDRRHAGGVAAGAAVRVHGLRDPPRGRAGLARHPRAALDPPLLMALDEVTQICPVPLPVWLADSGGKGIQILPVAHGEAQLRTRWGADGARVVLDTCDTQSSCPGSRTRRRWRRPPSCAGRRRTASRARSTITRHDVMTPDMIRRLPDWRALVIRGGLAPVIARLPMAWEDRLYKRARRQGWAVLPPPARGLLPLPRARLPPSPWRRRPPSSQEPGRFPRTAVPSAE